MKTLRPRSLSNLYPALLLATLVAGAPRIVAAQQVSPQLFNALKWRLVGPFRAGRVVAVSGVPGGGATFYFGGVDGGVWKTTDAGTVWTPIFDNEPVASIGALAVAPSDPKTIYVGTGESDIRSDLASGDGMYRSDDGGATWKHIGLEDSRQISRVLVDPNDARTVYVGVLGHAYGPSEQRGVYKSTDSGETWTRVLDKGPDVGIADVAMATGQPQILFATTWNAHRPPWSTYAPLEGAGNALYRTTDGGGNWTQIAGHGLPEGGWNRSGIAVSADGRRVYLTVNCGGDAESGSAPGAHDCHSGLYRSDDGGDSWTLESSDARITSRAWYFNSLAIDPSDSDVLYMPNVALYRTNDGGKTIEIVRGAPGGDDYHQIWVDPKDSNHLVLGVDQGTSVSLDRGKTWSTWYNQPTAQLYHVTTDHRFPYTIYGAQQDSGSIAVHSRSDHGHLDTRDWFLPGGSESGWIAIDPKDENIVYVTDTYGGPTRVDERTAFSQNISPWPLGGFGTEINQRKYRDPWTPVLVFSQADKTSLYLGTQYVMKTVDGGLHWDRISYDLTGAGKPVSCSQPPSLDQAETCGYGVVYAIAPSPLQADEIWAGSDTGLVHVTRDGGKTWASVTPPGLSPWSKIALIEASHFDPATAYVAVDRHRLDDRKPYLYITHDFGKTWTLSVNGIGGHDFVNAVREDPVEKNLLFAGTEFGIYVSFNGGAEWQPLQMNLPVTSVRDMDIHDDDLVIATHGRSFWVLDDMTPLRQAVAAGSSAHGYFYKPATAIRVDNDGFLGTPLPPEEPQADNPPNGAIIDYYLGETTTKVTLQILDAQGRVLRHFSSAEKAPSRRPLLPIAERWFPKPQMLETSAGEHRFVWDLNAGSSSAGTGDDDADDALGAPAGPRVPPGTYTLRLNVATGMPEDSWQQDRTLRVVMDPRCACTEAVLGEQYAFGQQIYAQLLAGRKAMAELESVATQIRKVDLNDTSTAADLSGAVRDAQKHLDAIRGGASGGGLAEAVSGLGTDLRLVESGDRTAPATAHTIFDQMGEIEKAKVAAWQQFKKSGLDALNAALSRAHREPIKIAAIEEQVQYAMTR